MPVNPQAVMVMPHFLAAEKCIGLRGSPCSNATCGGCERRRGAGERVPGGSRLGRVSWTAGRGTSSRTTRAVGRIYRGRGVCFIPARSHQPEKDRPSKSSPILKEPANDRAVSRRICLALCGNSLGIQHATTTPRQFEAPKARHTRCAAAMDRLLGKTKTANTDIFSDPSHRMSQRPRAVKAGEGLGFQDFGSSFDTPKAGVTYGKSSKSKFKPAEALPAKPRKALPISEHESDDELLLSSQNSMGGHATSSSRRVVKGKKPATPSDEEETVRVDGRDLAAHPDYKPSSVDAVKGLRFKKTKKTIPAGDAVADVPPLSSSLEDSQDLFRPISDDIEILDDPPPGGPSTSRQKPSETFSTRRKSPSAMRTAARRLPDAKDASTSKPSSPTAKDTPRSPAKPRPRPRVIIKSVPRKRDSSPESTPRPAARNRGIPLRSKTPELPTNADTKRTVKKSAFLSSSSHREPQEFPMSLQAKENVSDGARSGDASSSKTKKAVTSRAAPCVHTPKPIPLPSPLKTKRISRGTTFPDLSPLSSSNDKGKARAKSPDEDDVDVTDRLEKRGGPKPFPMSSQMLAGIDRRSKSPSSRSLTSTKRTSSDGSGAEQGRIVKKRKDSRSGCVLLIPTFSPAYLFAAPNLVRVLDALDYMHEPMEDDSSKPPMFWVFCSHTNPRIKLTWVTLETLQRRVPIATRNCHPIPHPFSNTCSQRRAKSPFQTHGREIVVV
jgi:hypothetical protein